MPYLPVSSRDAALGDRELALAREGLGLLRVLVDAADHQRRAVAPRERHDRAKRSSPSSRLTELMIALPWQ